MRLVFAIVLGMVLSAAPAAAHPGWGLVIDSAGRVTFADVDRNTIWRIEDGKLIALARGLHSHDLYLDARGNLWGEHAAYDAPRDRWLFGLWRLAPGGRPVWVRAPSDAPFEGVKALRGRAADGALYQIDGAAVRRTAADGTVTTPGGDPLAGVAHGDHPRLLGLAVEPAGHVLVADYDHGVVREIGADGRVRVRRIRWRSGPAWSPSGVALADGSLYILEHRPESLFYLLGMVGPSARVLRVEADGSAETLGVVGGWGRALLAAMALAALAAVGIGGVAWARRRRRNPDRR